MWQTQKSNWSLIELNMLGINTTIDKPPSFIKRLQLDLSMVSKKLRPDTDAHERNTKTEWVDTLNDWNVVAFHYYVHVSTAIVLKL